MNKAINVIELTSDDSIESGDSKKVVWPAKLGQISSLHTNLDSYLSCFGPVPAQAIDLVRIALAALIADRQTPRPNSWSRTLGIRVHVLDSSQWLKGLPLLVELLGFLTGDEWQIDLISDINIFSIAEKHKNNIEKSILFSGGLDSFAAAVINLNKELKAGGNSLPLFLSHHDNNIVMGSQNNAVEWIRQNIFKSFSITSCRLQSKFKSVETSSRSRSLLFLALGCAAALARGANILEMPENGFTSINPPLRDDRGGTLSTRSTHPGTILFANRMLEALQLNIVIRNPYEWYTKGELVKEAVENGPSNIAEGISKTLSCGKIDGRLYRGGNPNFNCGLCVGCLVRRASIIAANINDQTPYLIDVLQGTERDHLINNRRKDIQAIRNALITGVDEDTLIGSMPLQVNCDIDRIVDLCQRSLRELSHVELP